MLFIQLLACVQVQFDENNASAEYSGLIVTLTQQGFFDWINKNVQSLNIGISQVTIPDFSFDIIGFNIQFKDIKFTNVQLPEIEGLLVNDQKKNGYVFARWQGVQIQIGLKFQLQQTVYPYIRDSGPGQLIIQNAILEMQIEQIQNSECLYHIKLQSDYLKLNVQQMRVQLYGQYEFIYDSVLRIAANVVMEILNVQLQEVISDTLEQTINANMDQIDGVSYNHGTLNCVQTDQRWWYLEVENQYFKVFSPGNVCWRKDNTCFGQAEDKITVSHFLTNHEIQYSISKRSFQSQQNLLSQHYYNSSLACQVSLQKVGIQVTCNSIGTNFSSMYHIGASGIKWQYSDELQFDMSYNNYNLMNCTGNCSTEFFQEYNSYLKLTAIGYDNANHVDLQNCEVFYQKQWVVLGCNVDK